MKTYGGITRERLLYLVEQANERGTAAIGDNNAALGRNFADAIPELDDHIDRLIRLEQKRNSIARRLDKFLNGVHPQSSDLSEIVDKVEKFHKALGNLRY